VFGERFYVYDVLYDKKFKLKIYSGRPVAQVRGGKKFIVTAELKAFIMSTLDVSGKEFTDRLKTPMVANLRRLLQNNPFKTYEHWVNSKQKDKPRFITFNDAHKNPQILIDALGHRYVLFSALRAEEGFILPKGILEAHFRDKNIKMSTKHILTHDLAKHLEKINFKKYKKNAAISNKVFYSFCAELGQSPHKAHDDWNIFFVQHLDELLRSTTKTFFMKYPELEITQKGLKEIKYYINLVLKELKNPSSALIPALLEHWKQPNLETSKKADVVFGRNSSMMRRAFLLLKKAKRI